MVESFNMDDFRCSEISIQATPQKPKKRKKANGRFIRGPIPWNWITKLSGLSSSSNLVAWAIWHVAGLVSRETDLQIHKELLNDLNISRWTFARALSSLEKAGLVQVKRRKGARPLITILHPESLPEPLEAEAPQVIGPAFMEISVTEPPAYSLPVLTAQVPAVTADIFQGITREDLHVSASREVRT
jgi:DNA-binding MarR family transcriptional regulator